MLCRELQSILLPSCPPIVSGLFGRIAPPPLQGRNRGWRFEGIVRFKLLAFGLGTQKPCNPNPQQNQKRTLAKRFGYFFTDDSKAPAAITPQQAGTLRHWLGEVTRSAKQKPVLSVHAINNLAKSWPVGQILIPVAEKVA